MKKTFIAVILLALCSSILFPQNTQKRLAVLPFTGGEPGEGNAVAILFSQNREIINAFSVLPRTAALNEVFEEHRYQLDGLTDSDTIAGIGHTLNVDYVLSGNIRRLGNLNILIVTITHVESLELVAGHYRSFLNIGEIRSFLPSMSREMIEATQRNTRGLKRLAVVPFNSTPNAELKTHEADTLAQMLAISILNMSGYVILPRTSSIQTALNEINFQTEHTSEEGIAAAGRAVNADLTLSGTVFKLGNFYTFNAQIIDVKDGSLTISENVNYQVISDSIYIMPRLAILLTMPQGQERENLLANLPAPSLLQSIHEAEPQQKPAESRKSIFSGNAAFDSRRNLVDVFALFTFSGADDKRGLFGFGVGVSWSPFAYAAIGLEGKASFYTHERDKDGNVKRETFWTAAPNLGFAVPIKNIVRIFSNAFIEMGSFESWNTGLLSEWATPGFNIGIDINYVYNISIKYRGIIFKDKYVNGISIGVGIRF